MNDINSFTKKDNGRYINVNKSMFIKQPTSQVTPFSVERQLVDNFVGIDIPIYFTDINGGLYLTSNQLVDLFGVSENHIRNHINNIYGEYLDRNGIFTVNGVQDWGGTKCAPPASLIIYQLSVMYNKPSNMLELNGGGGGGSQQVLFYHHDMIVELAHRLNNNRARAISQYVKNLIHDYHRNMFVVHQDIDQYPNFATNLHRVATNFDPERHLMADVNNYLHQLAILLPDNWNPDGTINMQKVNEFKRKFHTNAHFFITKLTPSQILAFRSNPELLNFGQINYRGSKRPWNSELNNACNFYDNLELKTRSHYMLTVIGRCLIDITRNKLTLYGNEILKNMVYDIDHQLRLYTYSDWQECPEVIIPKVIDNGMIRTDFKLKVQRYYELYPRKLNLSMMEKQELKAIEENVGNILTQEININIDTDKIGIYTSPLPDGYSFL